jgi:hypothetical protein
MRNRLQHTYKKHILMADFEWENDELEDEDSDESEEEDEELDDENDLEESSDTAFLK